MIAVKIAITLCFILALAECSFLAQFARRDEPIEQGTDGDSCQPVVERCERQTHTSQEYPFQNGGKGSRPLTDIYGEPGYAKGICGDVNKFIECLRLERQQQTCSGTAIADALEFAETHGNYFCGLRYETLLPLAAQSPCLAGTEFPDYIIREGETCVLNQTSEGQNRNTCERFVIHKQCILSTVRRHCGENLTLLWNDLYTLLQSHRDHEDCEFSQEQVPAQAVKRAVSDFLNLPK